MGSGWGRASYIFHHADLRVLIVGEISVQLNKCWSLVKSQLNHSNSKFQPHSCLSPPPLPLSSRNQLQNSFWFVLLSRISLSHLLFTKWNSLGVVILTFPNKQFMEWYFPTKYSNMNCALSQTYKLFIPCEALFHWNNNLQVFCCGTSQPESPPVIMKVLPMCGLRDFYLIWGILSILPELNIFQPFSKGCRLPCWQCSRFLPSECRRTGFTFCRMCNIFMIWDKEWPCAYCLCIPIWDTFKLVQIWDTFKIVAGALLGLQAAGILLRRGPVAI